MEHGLEHADDELARRVIVIEQHDPVKLRPIELRLHPHFDFSGNLVVTHRNHPVDDRKNGNSLNQNRFRDKIVKQI
ncbi:hypothetical protein D3C71_2042400 [compost metagenome]